MYDRRALHLLPAVISAPFGNYIRPRGATATLGTFTRHARGGRVQRIVRTVRYYPRLRAWVNRIGLRNPGIDWLTNKVNAGKLDPTAMLVSVHGFQDEDWAYLLDATVAMKPLGIELNLSCPNVGEVCRPVGLFERAAGCGVPVIVKLPPVRFEAMFDAATDAGLTLFHCCNTLPVPAGGLSGAPLKPVALACIEKLRNAAGGERLGILGGGGIYTPADLDDFAHAGADWFAIGTKAMNPWLLLSHGPLRPLIDHAGELVRERGESSPPLPAASPAAA